MGSVGRRRVRGGVGWGLFCGPLWASSGPPRDRSPRLILTRSLLSRLSLSMGGGYLNDHRTCLCPCCQFPEGTDTPPVTGNFCSATLPKFSLCELQSTGKAQRALQSLPAHFLYATGTGHRAQPLRFRFTCSHNLFGTRRVDGW